MEIHLLHSNRTNEIGIGLSSLSKQLDESPTVKALRALSTQIDESPSVKALRSLSTQIDESPFVKALRSLSTQIDESPALDSARLVSNCTIEQLSKNVARWKFESHQFVNDMISSRDDNSVVQFDFDRDFDSEISLRTRPNFEFENSLYAPEYHSQFIPNSGSLYRKVLDPRLFDSSNIECPSINLYAYALLFWFETQLREFIDEKMTSKYGQSWFKHRTQNNMYTNWKQKQQKEVNSVEITGEPLIAYADFTDYLDIIARRDNWKEVFSRIFRRKTDIEESLVRVCSIRIQIMHARSINSAEYLTLKAEIARILRAIGFEF